MLKDIEGFSGSLIWSISRAKVRGSHYDLDTMGILEIDPDVICNISFLIGSWSKYLDNDISQWVWQAIMITLNKRFEDILAIIHKKAEIHLKSAFVDNDFYA